MTVTYQQPTTQLSLPVITTSADHVGKCMFNSSVISWRLLFDNCLLLTNHVYTVRVITLLQHIIAMSTAAKLLSPFFLCCLRCVTYYAVNWCDKLPFAFKFVVLLPFFGYRTFLVSKQALGHTARNTKTHDLIKAQCPSLRPQKVSQIRMKFGM